MVSTFLRDHNSLWEYKKDYSGRVLKLSGLGYEAKDNTWEPFKFLRLVHKLHEYIRGVQGVKEIKDLIPKEFRV